MAKRRPSMADMHDELEQLQQQITQPAQEILGHLYKALLAMPEITLKNGTKAKVEAYYEPQVDDEGEVKCGVDVRLDDGNLLEFTMHNSGWEKSFVADLAKQADSKQRER